MTAPAPGFGNWESATCACGNGAEHDGGEGWAGADDYSTLVCRVCGRVYVAPPVDDSTTYAPLVPCVRGASS